jgi:SAM-dependent methyltransferase
MHIGDVLKLEEVKVHIEEFLIRPCLTGLDLGCDTGVALYLLYHDFNFQRGVGVDLNSIEEIVKRNIALNKRLLNIDISIENSIFDVYKNNIKFTDDDKTGRDEYIDEINFNNVFEFHLKTRALQFLIGNTEKFDLVILSNLLHLIEDVNERRLTLSYAKRAIKKGGLIFVKVNHPENENAIRLSHIPYSDEDFYELFNKDFETIYINQNYFLDNKSTSKIFLGKLKGV